MSLRPILSFFGVSGALIGGAVIVIACSSSSSTPATQVNNGNLDGGVDSSSGISATKASDDVASAICARYNACAPAFITLVYGTEAACASRLPLSLIPGLGATGSVETPDEVEACAQAIPAMSCADLVGRNLPAACTPPPGTLADGTACAGNAQCKSGRCKVAATAICGTCTSLAAAGAPCAVDDDCVNGASCQSGACVTYGQSGATCSDTKPCNPTLGCVNGVCGAPGQDGASCTDSNACDQLNGYFCNPVSSKCGQATFAGASQPCGLVESNIVLCSGPGEDCNGLGTTSTQGACIAAAADNETCNATNGPQCAAPAVCVSGACTIPDPSSCQ